MKILSKLETLPLHVKCMSCGTELEVEKTDITKSITDREGAADIVICPVCKGTIFIDSSVWKTKRIK